MKYNTRFLTIILTLLVISCASANVSDEPPKQEENTVTPKNSTDNISADSLSQKRRGLTQKEIARIVAYPEKYGYTKIESYENLPGRVITESGKMVEDKERLKKMFRSLTETHNIYYNKKLEKSLHFPKKYMHTIKDIINSPVQTDSTATSM